MSTKINQVSSEVPASTIPISASLPAPLISNPAQGLSSNEGTSNLIDPLAGIATNVEVKSDKDYHESVGLSDMTVKSVMDRRALISSVNWPTDSPIGTILSSAQYPRTLIGSNSFPAKDLLKIHEYFSAHALEFTVQTSASPFSVGAIQLLWYPGHTLNMTTLSQPSDTPSNTKPHTGENMVDTYSTILQIGNGNTATITIPMTNILTVLRNKYPLINWEGSDEQMRFREKDWNMWGTFQIRVWNQLQGATADEDQFLPVKTWCRVINPYLALLRNPVENLVPAAAETEGIVMGVAAAVGGAIAAGATAAAPAIGTALAVGAAGVVTAGAGALIDKVGKHCTYYSEVGEAPMVMNMALTNDHRSIISLGYDRKDFHDSHVDLAPTPAEYDMKFIASRRSRIKVLRWEATNTGATALYFDNLNPWMGILLTKPDFTPLIRVSNLNFAALMFGYWRGSMTVTIEVVGNAFTRGALLIHYQPKGDTVVTNDISRITSYPHTVLNISDVRTVALRVPYNAVTPWSRVGKLDVSNPNAPEVLAEDTLGSIYIHVLNPLRTKGPSDLSFLEVNIYVHSDDMDFRYPYLNRGIAPVPGKINNLPFTEMMSSDALGPEVVAADNFGPGADPSPTKLMPTQHTDLAQLLTRRVPIQQFTNNQQYTRVRIPIPAIGIREGFNTGSGAIRTFANPNFYTLLAQAFAFQTGSQTLSIMSFGTTSQKCAVIAQIIYTGDEDWDDRYTRNVIVEPSTEAEFEEASTEDACIMMNMAVNSRQELGIPWYDIIQMLPAMVNYKKLSLGENTTAAFMPFAVVDLYINAVVGVRMQLATSVGPNFQFSQFLGAPTLAIYSPTDEVQATGLKRSNAIKRVKKPVVHFNEKLKIHEIEPETEGGRPKADVDLHKCAYCPSTPKSFNAYIRHLQTSHWNCEAARNNLITCAYCNRKGSPAQWTNHNSGCFMHKSHHCEKHSLTFADGERYLNHIRNAHARHEFYIEWSVLCGTRVNYPVTEMFSGFQSFSDVAQSMNSIKENVSDATYAFTSTNEKLADVLPQISELVTSSNKASESIAESLPRVANNFEDLSKKVGTTADKMTEITTKITSLIDTIQLALIPQIQKTVKHDHGQTARYIMNWTRTLRSGNIEPIMSDFIIELFEVFSPIDPGMTALLAKVVLSFFPVGSCIHDTLNALILSSASTFVGPLFEQFKEYFNIPKTEADVSTFTSYAQAIFTLVGFGFVVITGIASPGEFYKNLKSLWSFINLPRASASFVAVIEAIIKIKEWVYVTYFGKDPLAGYEWLEQNRFELLNFQTAYYDYQKYTPTKILNSPVLRNRSIEHGEFAKLLSFNLSKIKQNSNEINMLKQQADYFIALARQARTAPPTKVRCRPTVVTFQGGSQVGKTFVASTALPHYIQQAMEWPKEPVFMVSSSTDDFMSGYSQQMITMIDDLLQMKKGDDLNGFVNMIGNAPYRVNMASLDEKGTQFLSECVIVTMNDPHPKVDKFVTHPDAIYNRLYDHYFTVVPKPGFNKDGRLNTKKVRNQKLVNPDDYLYFYRVKYVMDEQTGSMKRVPAVGHETSGECVTFFDIVREVLTSIRDEEKTAELQNDPENEPDFKPFNEDDEDSDDESNPPEDSDGEDIDYEARFAAFTEAFYWSDFEKKNAKNPRMTLLQTVKWIIKTNTQYFANYDPQNPPDIPTDVLEQLYQSMHYLAANGYSENTLLKLNWRHYIHAFANLHEVRKVRKRQTFKLDLQFPKTVCGPDTADWFNRVDPLPRICWWFQFVDPLDKDTMQSQTRTTFSMKGDDCYLTNWNNFQITLTFTEVPYLGSSARDHGNPTPWYWKILNPIINKARQIYKTLHTFTRLYNNMWTMVKIYLTSFAMSLAMSTVLSTVSAGVLWLLGLHPKQITKNMDQMNKEFAGTIELLTDEYPFLFEPPPNEPDHETSMFLKVLFKRFEYYSEQVDKKEAIKVGKKKFREFAKAKKEEDPEYYSTNLSWMEESWNTEGFYSAGAPSTGAKPKGKVHLVTPTPGKKASKEAPKTESDVPLMFDILKKNVVRLTTNQGHSIRALAWKQDILIVNRHFMNTLFENALVKVTRWSPNAYTEQEIEFTVEFKEENYVTMEYEDDNPLDICLWKMGWKQGSFKDISSHFIKEKDFPSVTGQNGFRISNMITTINNMQYVENQMVHDVASGDFINFPVSIVARGETAPGLCGSPWVVTNNSLFGNVGKICGIHSWGITGLIGCTPISIEALESVGEALPLSFTQSLPTMEMQVDSNGSTSLVYHEFHGRVPPQKAFIQPRKTEIQPSPICNEIFPITHMPAVMSNRDPRLTDPSVFDTNLGRKTDHSTKWFKNPTEINNAAEHLKRGFRQMARDVEPRRLTMDEAINGVDGKAYMEDAGLEMRNSPGYPYNKTPGKGKFPYFIALPQEEGQRLKYGISDRELFLRIQERESLAKQGIVPPNSIWIDVMKDELRAIAKCKSGATRIVNAPPLDLMVLWNVYFGAFRLMFMNPKNIGVPLESALGVDPKTFWPEIGLHLREARATFGIDYTAFDSSQNSEFYRIIVDIINDWYDQSPENTKEDNIIRSTMFFEVGHTLHLYGADLYTDDHGLPSGVCGGFTTITNIIVNKLISRVTFQRTGLDINLYNKCVGAIFMGDDNLQWIKRSGTPEIAEAMKKYNRITLAQVADEVGMIVTMPDKSPDLTEYDAFEDLTFLKCGFEDNVVTGYYLPTMDEKTIYNLLNWYRPKHNPDQFKTNIEEALKFAAPHGRKFYDGIAQKLRSNDKIRAMYNDLDQLIPSFETVFYATYLPFGLHKPVMVASPLFDF